MAKPKPWEPKKKSTLGSTIKKALLVTAFGGAALTGAGYYTYNMAYNYSDGTRYGRVDKFSKKGALCKTYEGTALQRGFNNVGGQGQTASFDFSVWDKDVAEKIQDAADNGHTVKLHYREAKWTLSCLQDSNYVVTNVEKVDDSTGAVTPYVIAPLGNRGPARK